MSDRIAVMDAGSIEQLGTPREVYERPATRCVAGFIGTSNLLRGRVAEVREGFALLSLGPDDHVVVPVTGSVHTGQELEISVRPEKIDLRRDAMSAPRGASVLSGVVTEVVYHGTSTNYAVATTAGPELVVFDQNASSAEDLAGRGDHVVLTWNPQHSYPIGVS
jgi:spermidine/putrescine transport system ATP-binding protein